MFCDYGLIWAARSYRLQYGYMRAVKQRRYLPVHEVYSKPILVHLPQIARVRILGSPRRRDKYSGYPDPGTMEIGARDYDP
jgi:hypothetical protein